jgi:hypothetical protein
LIGSNPGVKITQGQSSRSAVNGQVIAHYLRRYVRELRPAEEAVMDKLPNAAQLTRLKLGLMQQYHGLVGPFHPMDLPNASDLTACLGLENSNGFQMPRIRRRPGEILDLEYQSRVLF